MTRRIAVLLARIRDLAPRQVTTSGVSAPVKARTPDGRSRSTPHGSGSGMHARASSPAEMAPTTMPGVGGRIYFHSRALSSWRREEVIAVRLQEADAARVAEIFANILRAHSRA